MPYSKRAKFEHERIAPPSRFDKRSFRTIKRGKSRIIVGCPKGHYDPHKKPFKQCDVGMKTQTILRPKRR